MPKIEFIINPIAGQGSGKLAIPEIDRLAKMNSLDFEVAITQHPGHAIDLARDAAENRVGVVIAVGGDGTSNEVLNGLMQAWSHGYTSTYMGIIGIGRGNDFAFAFGIPPGLEKGFNILMKNQPQPMDVGLVVGGQYPQGRYFGNGVGIGFDAVVGFEALKLIHLHGFLNYVVAALKTIFLYFHAPLVRIEYDQNSVIQQSLMVSIMNGRRMGGGFLMAPHAEPDDGYLDLCIAGQYSRMGILRMIPRFMKGTQGSDPRITTGQATKIHVSAVDGELPVHADGETVCTAGSFISVELLHQPIKILHG